MLCSLIVGILLLSCATYGQDITLPSSKSQNVSSLVFPSQNISIPDTPFQNIFVPVTPFPNGTIPIHPFHNSSLPVGMTITDIFDDVRNNAIKDELQELSKQLEILKKSRYIFDIWDLFQTEYNKTYNSTEEKNKRFNIFIDNFKMIVDENAKLKNLSYGFQLQVTKFADLTSEEFLEKWTGVKIDEKYELPPGEYVDDDNDLSEENNEDESDGNAVDASASFAKVEGIKTCATRRKKHKKKKKKKKKDRHRNHYRLTTRRPPKRRPRPKPKPKPKPKRTKKTLDYRRYMTQVDNQGTCGSCYSFAVTATIEGAYALKKGKKFRLSKQELVDCSPGNGCRGADPRATFEYIKQHRGIQTDASYPYAGVQQGCNARSRKRGAIKGFGVIPSGDEQAMKRALDKYGPLSIALNGEGPIQFYADIKSSGGSQIIDSPYCESKINHAVVVVGYGTQNGRDYWLVRNSWGQDWGLDGHFKIARNKNMCGVALLAIYAIV